MSLCFHSVTPYQQKAIYNNAFYYGLGTNGSLTVTEIFPFLLYTHVCHHLLFRTFIKGSTFGPVVSFNCNPNLKIQLTLLLSNLEHKILRIVGLIILMI